MTKLWISVWAFLLSTSVLLGQAAGPAESQAVNDQALHRQVHEQLATNPDLQNVQITVTNGQVQLSGSVPNKNDKKEASRLAKSVQGVKKVREDLDIKNANAKPITPAASTTRSDSKAPENTAGSIVGNAGTSTSLGSATSTKPESDSAASAKEHATQDSPTPSSTDKPSTNDTPRAGENPEQPVIQK